MLFFRTGASAQFEHGTVVEGVCIDSFSLSADYFPFFSTIQQRQRENDTRPSPLHLRSINAPWILFSNERSRVFEQGKVVLSSSPAT